jgi:hypothetical protein
MRLDIDPLRPDYTWLTWGVSSIHQGGLPLEATERLSAERKKAGCLRITTRTIPLQYVEDPSVPSRFIAHERRLENPRRRVASFTFGGVPVHVDRIEGRGYSPGFGFVDLRIFFNYELRGRAWRFGCALGIGGIGGPAVVLLRNELALVVADDHESVYLRRLTPLLAAKRRWQRKRRLRASRSR